MTMIMVLSFGGSSRSLAGVSIFWRGSSRSGQAFLALQFSPRGPHTSTFGPFVVPDNLPAVVLLSATYRLIGLPPLPLLGIPG
jgi:hypothetical protein